MKITIESHTKAPIDAVWRAWNTPADVVQWNTPSPDWHTTKSTIDLRDGGKFHSRMEAKDGSFGFDFEGTYTRVVPNKTIEYAMTDGREVQVVFTERAGGVDIRTTFDAESENSEEMQRDGWQAIQDSFVRHVEAKG